MYDFIIRYLISNTDNKINDAVEMFVQYKIIKLIKVEEVKSVYGAIKSTEICPEFIPSVCRQLLISHKDWIYQKSLVWLMQSKDIIYRSVLKTLIWDGIIAISEYPDHIRYKLYKLYYQRIYPVNRKNRIPNRDNIVAFSRLYKYYGLRTMLTKPKKTSPIYLMMRSLIYDKNIWRIIRKFL